MHDYSKSTYILRHSHTPLNRNFLNLSQEIKTTNPPLSCPFSPEVISQAKSAALISGSQCSEQLSGAAIPYQGLPACTVHAKPERGWIMGVHGSLQMSVLLPYCTNPN